VDRWHEEQMEKHGWYYHAVFGEAKPEFPTGFNAHTHGLPDKYNHRDFELVFPFQHKISQVIGSIFWNFAKRIEGGERFEPNQEVSEIIRNFNIKLIPAYRDDEKVLRIILPDAEGKLNESELHGDFAMQYHHAKEF
jgi:hypothetical protein